MTTPVRLRSATIEDSEQLAGVHTRSWQVAYRGQLPDALLDGLDPRDRVAGWRLRLDHPGPATTLVAVDDRSGRIVGFIVVGPDRDGEQPEDDHGEQHPRRGEVYAIYVDPPWWGRRVGTELITTGMERLRHSGFAEAALWVLEGNDRTQRFYERHGWRQDGERRTERIHDAHADGGDTEGTEVVEVRYIVTLATASRSR